MSTHVVTFLSRCPDRVFTHFFVLVHRQATLPSSETLAAEGRAPCKVYQVAYLQNQPSEDARRAIARAQRAPRGRRVRLDLQRVLPARLRRARDPLHAALASFQTRGGDSDGNKAGSILIREGVATKSGQPEPQLDQGRAQKELQGRRKNAEKGGIFREEIIYILNRVFKRGGRAGRCPGPAAEVVDHLEVSRFIVLGSSLLTREKSYPCSTNLAMAKGELGA